MPPLAKKFFYLIEPGKRGRWYLLIVLAFGISILEAASAFLIFLLMKILADPNPTLTLPVVGRLDKVFPEMSQDDLFLSVIAFIGGFFLLRGGAYLVQSYLQNRIALNAGVRLASRLLMGYLRMPYSFHLQRNSAELIRNAQDATSDVAASVFSPVVTLVSESMVVVGVLAVLIASAPLATLLAAAALAPLVWILLRVVQPRLKLLGDVRQEMVKRCIQSLQQSLQGIREIKLLGRAAYFENHYAVSRASLARSFYIRTMLLDVPRVSVETILILCIIGFLGGTVLTGRSPAATLSVLGLFAYAVLRILPSLNRAVANLNTMKFGAAAIEVVYDDLILLEEADHEVEEEVPPLLFEQAIVMKGVRFHYPGRSADVFSGVNLKISRGESIGFVGPTGGGKTTLVDLITGLLTPAEGTVTVDGADIQKHLTAWHLNLGVIPQTMFLMDDTVRRNVAFGVYDEEIDEDRVIEAITTAQLMDFIDELPEGLDTVVGEQGVRLSGGQRQRVAIARALYRRPTILVFDEGTSALDVDTERQLMEALQSLRKDRTLIIVAHRLTTVRSCDHIYLVDKGHVEPVSSYDELLSRSAELEPTRVSPLPPTS